MKTIDKEVLKNTIKELLKLRNPHVNTEFTDHEINGEMEKIKDIKNISRLGMPISKNAFLELVTSRNRNLVLPHEQKKLLNTTVAIFGMSVGSSAAISWMSISRANDIKIIDPDVIEATNLNRLPFGFDSLGVRKVDAIKESLLKLNPFANIYTFTRIEKQNLNNVIFRKNPNVHLVVDEMDDFESKLELRKLCKKYKIPLVSAADVGDMTMVDVERYDTDKNLSPFLGRLGDVSKLDFKKMGPFDKKKLIIKLVGFDHNSERILESLMAIGGTVTTWPQLGATASMTGGVTALTIKKIILGEDVKSGRYFISLDEVLVDDFNVPKRQLYRERLINNIKEVLKI